MSGTSLYFPSHLRERQYLKPVSIGYNRIICAWLTWTFRLLHNLVTLISLNTMGASYLRVEHPAFMNTPVGCVWYASLTYCISLRRGSRVWCVQEIQNAPRALSRGEWLDEIAHLF